MDRDKVPPLSNMSVVVLSNNSSSQLHFAVVPSAEYIVLRRSISGAYLGKVMTTIIHTYYHHKLHVVGEIAKVGYQGYNQDNQHNLPAFADA